MGDYCTLETLDTEERAVATPEEYRFTFIRYLETAEQLLDLKGKARSIAGMQRIRTTGRLLGPPEAVKLQEKQALEAEKTLSRLYDIDYSSEGFERAKSQFDADLLTLKKQEQALWGDLVSVVDRIDVEGEYGPCQVWLEDDAEAQRTLMVADETSTERVYCYRKCLRQFEKKPELPSTLEIVFTLTHGSLINSVPFRV